jgi:hypothetical protein
MKDNTVEVSREDIGILMGYWTNHAEIPDLQQSFRISRFLGGVFGLFYALGGETANKIKLTAEWIE